MFAIAIISPLTSYAYTNDESVVKTALAEHQQAVSKYATANKKELPSIVEYKYGMNLDIAKVIRTSPELRECKVVPQLMTYEDSKGSLNTVQYQVMSRCRGKN
jgi:hypothetical protein